MGITSGKSEPARATAAWFSGYALPAPVEIDAKDMR